MDRHPLHFLSYVDSAARLAALGYAPPPDFIYRPFGEIDHYQTFLQKSDNTYWVLTNYSPITWVSLGGFNPHAPEHGIAGLDPLQHDNIAGSGTNTHAQIDTHIVESETLSGFGSPNGVVVGSLGQSYYDMTGGLFYHCNADATTSWQII